MSTMLQSAGVARYFLPSRITYLSSWLLKNEHQPLSILFETMKEKGYTKEEIKLAVAEYMNSPESGPF